MEANKIYCLTKIVLKDCLSYFQLLGADIKEKSRQMIDIRERHDKNSNSSPEHSREENTEMET